MTTARTADTAHREIVLEDHLVEQMVIRQGYRQRQLDDYDRASALDRALVLEFVQGTQANEWTKLVAHYAGSAENEFFKQLDRALKQRGTLDVLRNGLKLIPGLKFTLCAFKPASGLNAELTRLFAANVLSVIRQVRYSLKNENAIDVVLFVNGLPVATLELKNLLTGSTYCRTARRPFCRSTGGTRAERATATSRASFVLPICTRISPGDGRFSRATSSSISSVVSSILESMKARRH
jgi:type I restriction enzyme R subunit